MDSWYTFAVIVGGAAAALLGLLFVAISIRLNIIAESGELRSRAAQTLIQFGVVLLAAVLLTVPSQPPNLYGAELVVLAAASGGGLYALERRAAKRPSDQRIGPVLKAVSPNAITPALLLACGIVLCCGVLAGLYILIAPVVAAFVGGLANAWLFMTRLQE